MRTTNPEPKLWLAIPLMDELENLPNLIADISAQTYRDFEVICCVNQPDTWWNDPIKFRICENNISSLQFLKEHTNYHLLDYSSRDTGWKGKQFGVGWARKIAMEECASLAKPGDVIVSLDGDTRIRPQYFKTIVESLGRHPRKTALAVPYYHQLTQDEVANRAILRYEIYMRYYVINLWRIGSPFAFSALGSAIAVPVWAYKAIGGMTPNKSGEDFYFLQKLRKFGEMLFWNEEMVYPAARFSDRVFFGTGPAMMKGAAGDWSSYPLYDYKEFDLVSQTYQLFPDLFSATVATPMDLYLAEAFKEQDLWQPLRDNNPEFHRFLHACHGKLDGLRILQFLKSRHAGPELSDERNLYHFLLTFFPNILEDITFSFYPVGFDHLTINELDMLRNELKSIENEYQKQHDSLFS
ncbi:MAG: hypothetical protein WCO63_07315 [Bacteroidota bacterium]